MFAKRWSILRARCGWENPDGIVGIALLIWWGCNLLTAGCSELANDEAYYHLFAEQPAWGYFDHPPVTAWLVGLGEWLFGATEFGVRFFFTWLQPLYLWILWRLIRPAEATRQDAALYAMICAATLMLQLYGFIAVPDGPLMASAALFLCCCQRFDERRRGAWLLLGCSMAVMAYCKYHGALVVLFAVAANLRWLRRPGLYGAGAVAIVLLIPHLMWQYHHDWVSFVYHLSARNNLFKWSNVGDYLLNLLVVFNPFYVPLYVAAWCKVRPQRAVERILKLLPPAFIGFFGLSLLRGYVQPQWVIVAVFGLIYLLFAYLRERPRLRRYAMRAGWVTLGLLVLVRIEIMFNPLGIRFEVFDNAAGYGRIAEIAAGRPVIYYNNYTRSAKYRFYTGGEVWSSPDVSYRAHQWMFRTDDDAFAGREVIAERPEEGPGTHTEILPNGHTFIYTVDPAFLPVRRVGIEVQGLPREAAAGDTLTLDLRLTNPYGYAIRIGGETALTLIWKNGILDVREFALPAEVTLPPHGSARCRLPFRVPESLAGTEFQVGFALTREGYAHWFHGNPQPVNVRATKE